jgi:hypothetical protein
LIVSRSANQRRLGLYLFDRLTIETIPRAVLDESGEHNDAIFSLNLNSR